MIAPLLLGLLLGCTPDETGYGDTDFGTTEGDGLDDMGAEGPRSDLDGLSYTAEQTLGEAPVPVTLLALPGTFAAPASLVVAVAGRGPGVTVDVVDGGFVAVVSAALGDVASVVEDDEILASVVLGDDLGPVAAAGDGDGTVPPEGAPREVAAGEGGLQVGDGALSGFVPPYVAFNAAAGAARRVGRGDVDVLLPAERGDEVCVAPEVDGRLRVAVCFSVQ